MNLLNRILFTLLLGLMALSSRAGHLMGGEMYYDCINDSTYAVTLILYRDCDPGQGAANFFDDSLAISIIQASNNQYMDVKKMGRYGNEKFIPLVTSLNCFADTPQVCMKQQLYRDTFNINVPTGGVHLVMQRCCRSPNAINIAAPSNQYGTTYYSFIPDPEDAVNNSSVRFSSALPKVLCIDVFQELNFAAEDPDGDSLVYSFCLPYHGGSQMNPNPDFPTPPPFQKVQPAMGFSATYQIDAFPAFEIDSATGIAVGKPIQSGGYIITVCVEEYRDGVPIGESRRDFLINAFVCDIEAAAAIDSALEECIGFDITFVNASTIGKSFVWDFGDTTTISDTSNVTKPSYTYPDTGTYTVMLIARGNGSCRDTTYLDYRVQHKIEPFFEPPPPDCFDVHRYRFKPEGFARDTTTVTWIIHGSEDSIKFRKPRTMADYRFEGPGDYTVTLLYEDFGCSREFTDTVTVWPNPDFKLLGKPLTQCAPFEAEAKVISSNAYKPTFFWLLDTVIASEADTAKLQHTEPGNHDVTVWMFTDSLCIDTIVHHYPGHVTVLDTPIANFQMVKQEVGMFHPNFRVEDASIDAASVSYFIENQWLSNRRDHNFDLIDTGNYVLMQAAVHANSCVDTTHQIIRVNPEYLTYIPNSFTPNGDGINDTWRASVYTQTIFELRIFDQWGKPVFGTEDPYYEWNGTKWNSGDPCQNGIYTYDIHIEDNEHREWYYNGYINLVR